MDIILTLMEPLAIGFAMMVRHHPSLDGLTRLALLEQRNANLVTLLANHVYS